MRRDFFLESQACVQASRLIVLLVFLGEIEIFGARVLRGQLRWAAG